MWHTLPEAIRLTGRSRRSLYRDMDAGRVSYRVGTDGRRELETSELIRAYGALAQMAQSVAQPVAHSGTPDGTVTADALVPLLEELRLLRAEVKDLRETMLLLEHKPQPKPYDGESRNEPATGGNQPPSGAGVSSFADLVARFNARH